MRPSLDRDEQSEQNSAGDHRRERTHTETVVLKTDQPEDERAERERRQDGAGDVRPPATSASSRLSRTQTSAMTMTANARGILMRNTARHETCWVSQPPSTGPRIVVTEEAADHVPIALPRVVSSYAAVINARLSGIISEPPMP